MSDERETDRREVLKSGLAIGGLAATAGMPFWSKLALAQDEELVPFTDVAEDYALPPKQPGGVYFQDTRNIDSFYTPNDQFYVVQHYGHPEIDTENYKLRLTGLVDRPLEFTLDELKGMNKVEMDAGFECGGNRRDFFHGLIGNAKWGGVRLSDLLANAGVQDAGIEVVFYGSDKGPENIRNTDVEQAFARSMHIDDALADRVIVAWEMNGEPLPAIHGAPVRLIVGGWYGVANVKWLDHSIVRVTRRDGGHRVTGFVLNDGTPLDSVEISIDGGAWRKAEVDPDSSPYSWKLFYLDWDDAAAGEHTLMSRVTDANGQVQATVDQMPEKPSRWENYAQFERKVMIS
jgi:DMSO/TMAO reductase YedYZ molybdopterin-dependent catalytic subunit